MISLIAEVGDIHGYEGSGKYTQAAKVALSELDDLQFMLIIKNCSFCHEISDKRRTCLDTIIGSHNIAAFLRCLALKLKSNAYDHPIHSANVSLTNPTHLGL